MGNIIDSAAVFWCPALAFALTLAALGHGIYFIFRRPEKMLKAALVCLGGVVFFQAAAFLALTAFFWQLPENRFLTPLNTSHGMALGLGFCVNALLLALETRRGTGVTFVFVLPWSLLTLAYPLFSPPELAAFSLAARSAPAAAHNLLFMVSYAMFINAFGASCALLLADRELRAKTQHEAAFALPPIGDTDRLIWRLVSAGYPFFLGGFLLASAQLYAKYSRLPGSDVKELGALAALAVYGVYLLLRKYGDWRGTKAAWANVAGFVLVIATLLLSSRAVSYHKFFH